MYLSQRRIHSDTNTANGFGINPSVHNETVDETFDTDRCDAGSAL